jgi:hypothetical protein
LNKQDFVLEIKEICIKENVIFLEKILFLFILQTKNIRFMIKLFGGVINGML